MFSELGVLRQTQQNSYRAPIKTSKSDLHENYLPVYMDFTPATSGSQDFPATLTRLNVSCLQVLTQN